MAFSLQKFQAYGIEPQEPVFKRYVQRAVLSIVALNTDTALDIASITAGSLGTFWTAAIADATYGLTVATPAAQAIRDIVTKAESFNWASGQELWTRKLATAVAGGFAATAAGKLPSIAFFSTDA